MALYTIESNGCLNGVYTYNNTNGIISNEILRKKLGDLNNDLCGEYNSIYFDIDNSSNEANLKIEISKDQSYIFTWEVINKKEKYEGIGYKMNERQIAVYYRRNV